MSYMYTNLSSWRMSDCAIDRILPVDLPKTWAILQTYLDLTPTMWEVGYDQQTFADEVLSGTLQLWVITENNQILAFAATQVRVIGPKKSVVIVWLAGKRMTEKRLMQFGIDCAHRYAAYVQAAEVRIEGRPGWQRLLAKLGFTQKHVVLSVPTLRERMN